LEPEGPERPLLHRFWKISEPCLNQGEQIVLSKLQNAPPPQDLQTFHWPWLHKRASQRKVIEKRHVLRERELNGSVKLGRPR
jgi:hypothetical protein